MSKYKLDWNNYRERKPVPGLDQSRGKDETLSTLHNPQTGWPIHTYSLPADIWLQDDLTFKNGNILELEKYKLHYGASIDGATFYVWHRNLNHLYPDLNFVYYPQFHFEQHQAIKLLGADKLFEFNDDKQFNFLCLNMNERSHRNTTLQLLQDMPSRLISYKARNWNIAQHPDDWTIERYNQGTGSQSNAENLIQLHNVYNLCQFSVVTETRYNLPYDFITEKTTQCFVALHPALYVSNRLHVQELRNYGFDVFDDIFDHSYDKMSDENRIYHMVESNRTVLESGIKDYNKLKNRLLKNRQHYLDPSCPIYEVK